MHGFFGCILLLVLLYSCNSIQLIKAQTLGWKSYPDPDHKFGFSYPADWLVKNKHDNITGSSEVILSKANSTRTQVSILYNANYMLLMNPKTGKPIVPSRALANLEKQISLDYVSFNATGKFPHKYTIQNHQSAGDIADYEKSAGKLGKMLIVFAKINNKDSCSFIYSDSKRLFYKNLPSISQIIRSIQILS